MVKLIKLINQLLKLARQTYNKITILIHSAINIDKQWFSIPFSFCYSLKFNNMIFL